MTAFIGDLDRGEPPMAGAPRREAVFDASVYEAFRAPEEAADLVTSE